MAPVGTVAVVRMLRRLGVLLAALAVAAPAHADALRNALDRLQKRYDDTRTLQADFRQVVESKALAGKLETKGKVAFEKPNRMRWDYAPPDAQTIVGDGSILWIYQPDLKQVIKAPLNEAFQSSTPITFLAGLGNVERDFDPSLVREERDRWILKLVPKAQDDGRGDARTGGPEGRRQRGRGPHRGCRRHLHAHSVLGRETQRQTGARPLPLRAPRRG